jgi:replicative DNA helicase
MNDASRTEAAHVQRPIDDNAATGDAPGSRPDDAAGGDAPAESWPPLLARALPGFPVDALPAPVAAWVAAIAEHTQTPSDLAAIVALGVLSAAALGCAVVDCGAWEEEPALYLLPALPSGERKSTVVRAATEPLRAIERERRDAAKPALHKMSARRTALESRGRKLGQQTGDGDAAERVEAEHELARVMAELDEVGVAIAPRILVDDVTPEKLGSLLAQHGSLAAIVAESALIDTIVGGRYSDGKANLHLICKAYNGEPTTIDRKGHDTEYLERPLLAITLVVQPHVLEGILAHRIARAQGLVGRFAYALPETLLGRRRVDPARVPPEVSAGWAEVVRRVAGIADNADNDDSPEAAVGIVSTFQPQRIPLGLEAERHLTELRRQTEPRLGPGGDLAAIADWAHRHHGRVARIAGNTHLCEAEARQPISENTMLNALRIGDYFLAHGIAAFTGTDARTHRALRWLEARGTVTLRELHRGPLGSRGTSAEAEKLADDLQRLNALRELPPTHPTSREFEVHPDLAGNANASPPPPARTDETKEPADATDLETSAERRLSLDSRSSPHPAPRPRLAEGPQSLAHPVARRSPPTCEEAIPLVAARAPMRAATVAPPTGGSRGFLARPSSPTASEDLQTVQPEVRHGDDEKA